MSNNKLTLTEKIENNEELLSNLQRKKENIEVQIENLQHKIKNQKRAIVTEKPKGISLTDLVKDFPKN